MKKFEEMTRADFMWLTMWFALMWTIIFGLAENYFAAWLCTMYMLIITVLNVVREHREQIKKEHRDCGM